RWLSLRPTSSSWPPSTTMRRPLLITTRQTEGEADGAGASTTLGPTSRVGTSAPAAARLSEAVVSRRTGEASRLAPHSEQKIVPSSCWALQWLQRCIGHPLTLPPG